MFSVEEQRLHGDEAAQPPCCRDDAIREEEFEPAHRRQLGPEAFSKATSSASLSPLRRHSRLSNPCLLLLRATAALPAGPVPFLRGVLPARLHLSFAGHCSSNLRRMRSSNVTFPLPSPATLSPDRPAQ